MKRQTTPTCTRSDSIGHVQHRYDGVWGDGVAKFTGTGRAEALYMKNRQAEGEVSAKVEVIGQPSHRALADIMTTFDNLKLFLSLLHWLCFFWQKRLLRLQCMFKAFMSSEPGERGCLSEAPIRKCPVVGPWSVGLDPKTNLLVQIFSLILERFNPGSFLSNRAQIVDPRLVQIVDSPAALIRAWIAIIYGSGQTFQYNLE
jgi:hypothetical protein